MLNVTPISTSMQKEMIVLITERLHHDRSMNAIKKMLPRLNSVSPATRLERLLNKPATSAIWKKAIEP